MDVEKTKRSREDFIHKKGQASGISFTKEQALKDIACHVLKGGYNENYIQRESVILLACSCPMYVYHINTNLL